MLSTQNPNAILGITPHYTNESSPTPKTVFGNAEKGLLYDYLDQLWKQDYLKAKKAVETADEGGTKPKTASWYQVFLDTYLGYKVELKHILSGCNWNTGYPYVILGYKENVE